IEPLDQCAPGHVEPQILWFVHDMRAISESHNTDAAAAVMWIGNAAADLHDIGGYGRVNEFVPNRWQIGGQPFDEFARPITPFPSQNRDQSQQHRLLLEQLA